MGALAFHASFGFELARPSRLDWLLNVGGDWLLSFAGWHLFRAEAWMQPMGATRSLIYPIGTSVGLTDSIPLVAVPLKAIAGPPGTAVQYIGLWILCCFVLQGVFGTLLMRTRTASVPLQLLGAALFVLAPPFLARTGHAALLSQWLILAALCVYFGWDDARWQRRAFAAFAAIVFVAAATHPYLTLMVLALVTAYYARLLLSVPDRRRWLAIAAPVPVFAVLAALVFWQAGYFVVRSGALDAGGLSVYSMNLLAPIMPLGRSRIFGDAIATATGGQYEGFAYFGAGVLALVPIALAAWIAQARRASWKPRRRSLPLAFICVLLTLLALSPRITFGSTTVLHYSEAAWGPLSAFRASGRLFWPVFYLSMFACLVSVTRLAPRAAATVLTMAVAVQAFDLSAVFAESRHLRSLTWRTPLSTDRFWSSALPHYRHLSLYPTNICHSEALSYSAFALLAGRFRNTLNAGETARPDVEQVARYCADLELHRSLGLVAADTLYVMAPALAAPFAARAQPPVQCADVDGFAVCFVRSTYQRWQDAFDIASLVLPAVEELAEFYRELNDEYRTRLARPPQTLATAPEERLALLRRYAWYRTGGCDHAAALEKAFSVVAGDVRICGDPFRRQSIPSVVEVFEVRRQMDTRLPARATPAASPTYVDAEGEAVWFHRYLAERLAGRDAYGARVAVLNAIRAIGSAP